MKAPKAGLMKMKQLSQASGLPVSTIKFYLSKGLLPEPKKVKPNVVYYDETFLSRLQIIKAMREEGLSVKSIRAVLDRYGFDKVEEWKEFRSRARSKDVDAMEKEERLAVLSEEERRREEILQAAFEVFSAQGYHNTTMDDIAEKAGVSKGTCYQYFEGKEEIFVATVERSVENLLEEADAASSGARDAAVRLGIKGLTFMAKYRDVQLMFMGLVSESLSGNRRLREKGEEAFSRLAEYLARDIARGIEEGVFRPVDPLTVAYALIGIAELVGNRSVLEEGFDVFSFFVHLTDFLQHGLSAGPGKGEPTQRRSPPA
jgi:AcrR family transcriptional regulator/predicted DNA-binding transcriptional regulator AlpA